MNTEQAIEANYRDIKLQAILGGYSLVRLRKLQGASDDYIKGFWDGHKLAKREAIKTHDHIFNSN